MEGPRGASTRGSRYRRDQRAGVPVIAIVIAVVVAASLLAVVVVWPYLSRADGWANDPNDPPDGVEDDDADPAWQGRFYLNIDMRIDIHVITGKDECGEIKVADAYMRDFERYDGDPWSLASIWPSSWWKYSDTYTMKYTLTISHSRTEYEDSGSFTMYRRGDSDDYDGTHYTRWFFFWGEQAGKWTWDLELSCKGKTVSRTGSFTIASGGTVKNG